MGREWYRKIGTTSTRRGGCRRDGRSGGDKDSPSGCMSSVLQFLHFNPFPVSLQHHRQSLNNNTNSFLPLEPSHRRDTRKGMETEEIEAAPLSSILEKDIQRGLHTIPMRIQISTTREAGLEVVPRRRRRRTTTTSRDGGLLSSESSSSPGLKSPNLVARLMGLDLIPESPSPSIRSGGASTPQRKSRLQQTRKDCGTRSLPETPRTSSAGRRSDVDRRLSLQINRENNSCSEEELGRRDFIKRMLGDETIRSPVGCARQIVRQVKENTLSRRGFGVDITNNVGGKRGDGLAIAIPAKSKKSSTAPTKSVGPTPRPSKPATATASEAKYQAPYVRCKFDENQPHSPINCSSKPPGSQLRQRDIQKQRRKAAEKCEKAAGERLGSVDLKKRPEKPRFVRTPARTAKAPPTCKKSSTAPLRLQHSTSRPPTSRRSSQWPPKFADDRIAGNDGSKKPAGAEFEHIAAAVLKPVTTDAKIEGELSWTRTGWSSPGACEVEEIVAEVQRHILDALVRETAAVFGGLFPVRRHSPRHARAVHGDELSHCRVGPSRHQILNATHPPHSFRSLFGP